jgi:thiamine biosynthesis lipoprotein
MRYKEWINLLIIVILLGISYWKYTTRVHTSQRSELLLGTYIDIRATSKDNEVSLQVSQAFDIIRYLEKKFCFHDTTSVLFSINHNDSERHDIDADFYALLLMADDIYRLSGGLYDVSIGRLIELWDWDAEVVPPDSMIDTVLLDVGFHLLRYDETSLYKPIGMMLDFGSIAKGYIIDKVIDYFVSKNVMEVYINAGGDIRFFSNNSRKWRVGIRHPRAGELVGSAELIGRLHIPDMAVVTSGDYHRFFIKDGIRYHHILNPTTGHPARPTVSVTVISPSAFIADALSTAAFVIPPEQAIEMINHFPQAEAIIYYSDDAVGDEIRSVKSENISIWLM